MAKVKGFKRPFRPHAWLLRHAQTMLYSLGRLMRKPLGTLLTAAVMGIAIALPVGMHALVSNLQTVADGWQGAISLSVFLQDDLKQTQIDELIQKISNRSGIEEVSYISPQQAMAEFRQLSGFGTALELLDENPLPPVLLVQPTTQQSTPEQTESLLKAIRALPEVDMVQADMQWVKRFQGITKIIQHAASGLAVLLGLAVVLIMGNTIRLEIQARRKEIEIIKLVGGTNAFTCRPFLYEGFWYGLFGGIIACGLTLASFMLLSNPVMHLAGLYDSSFKLSYLPMSTILAVLAGSTLLGLSGAWLAVRQHIKIIEPV